MSFRVHHNTLTLLAAPVNETENVPTVSASLRRSPSWPWMYAMAWASDVPVSLDEWPCLVLPVCQPFSTTMSSQSTAIRSPFRHLGLPLCLHPLEHPAGYCVYRPFVPSGRLPRGWENYLTSLNCSLM